MKYSQLVEVYEKINSTTKTLEKTDIIAEFLKTNGCKTYIMKVYPIAEGVMFNVDLASLKTEDAGKPTVHLTEKEDVTVRNLILHSFATMQKQLGK